MVNIFGILFVRRKNAERVTPININHERIHTAQMKELWFVLFYLYYLVEWLYLYLVWRDSKWAYMNVSFEREAYKYQGDLEYLKRRHNFAWVKYSYPATITLMYALLVLVTVGVFWIFT